MIDSRHRLVTIAAVYGLGVAMIGAHVAYTMTVQHEVWEKRSYTNRWAFRDVPTRRGSIRDRRGELLRSDAPTTSLELYYRVFRRSHPAALAIHGANHMLTAAGRPAAFGFARAHPARAFERMLTVTLEQLRDRADPDRTRDLRFYVSALFAALTDSGRGAVTDDLRQLLGSPRGGPVVLALRLDPAALRRVFQQYDAALRRLADELAAAGTDLYRELADFDKRRVADDRSEYVPRTLRDGLDYAAARRIAVQREWFPGFRVRPSVSRRDSELAVSWDSVRRLLGAVVRDWDDKDSDNQRRAAAVESMMPEFERMAAAADEVPEELRDEVTERLRRTLESHIVNWGRVGRSGVEAGADAVLQGNAGLQWVARARRRADVGLWSTFDVTPGEDVRLTIDLRLQHLLEQAVDDALAGPAPKQKAAIAIVDPATGDILAVVSRPLRAHDEEGRRGLGTAVKWPGNGAIGSLAKPLMLAEYLDARRHGRPYRDHTTFEPCQGPRKMADFDPTGRIRRFNLRCDHVHGDDVFHCDVSLGVSCNTFFFQVGEGLLPAGVQHGYQRFGLYRPPARGDDPRLPAAFQARVPGIPAWAYPDPYWGNSDDVHRRSIGYYVAANVLQVARAYCGLATGRLPELSLLVRPPEELRSVDLGLHPDDLQVVRAGMRYCVERGTAADLGLTGVWAKTGTAEVGGKDARGRANNNAWLAGFVGLAPVRLVFASVVYNVEHGGYGAKIAGPMFAGFLKALRADPALAKEYL